MLIRHEIPISTRLIVKMIVAKLKGHRLYVEISADNYDDEPRKVYTTHCLAPKGKPEIEVEPPTFEVAG